MNHNKQKSEIRQFIRKARNQVSQQDSKRAEGLLAAQLFSRNLIKSNQNVACFLSFDGEISTHAVLSDLTRLKANCFLPKLRPYKPNRLWFLPYKSDSPMSKNRFGIAEVDLPINKALAVSKLDIVLLPLVAFDLSGNRLGMGGGFYDATFEHLRLQTKRPKFIGLAYELQKLAAVPTERWDLPLDGVCTEANFYPFTDRSITAPNIT